MNLFQDSKNSYPPRAAATDPEDAFLSTATAAVATSLDMWTAYTHRDATTGPPKGKVWVELEAVGFDVYLRFCRSALTATTSSTGALLKVGIPRYFYLDPQKDKFIDHLSTNVGVLKYRVCSQIGERSRV